MREQLHAAASCLHALNVNFLWQSLLYVCCAKSLLWYADSFVSMWWLVSVPTMEITIYQSPSLTDNKAHQGRPEPVREDRSKGPG